jgi:mRNA-degrading endonuclease RelE of RelBE toxin-antitoxin system
MNSGENWELKIDPDIFKYLLKLPTGQSEKILDTIKNLSFNPYAGDIKKIKGEKNLWRKRIGSYRIFYEIYPEKGFIHVSWMERRTSKTY